MPAKENNTARGLDEFQHSARSYLRYDDTIRRELALLPGASEMRGIKRNVSLDFRTEIEAALSFRFFGRARARVRQKDYNDDHDKSPGLDQCAPCVAVAREFAVPMRPTTVLHHVLVTR